VNWLTAHSHFSICQYPSSAGRPTEDGGDDPDHALIGDDLVDFAFEVLKAPLVNLDLAPSCTRATPAIDGFSPRSIFYGPWSYRGRLHWSR